MTISEQKLDALIAFVMADSNEDRIKARQVLFELKDKVDTGVKHLSETEVLCHELLLEMGVNPAGQGYNFLVAAILEFAKDTDFTNRMMRGAYPYLAQKFDTVPQRIEACIRRCVESAFFHSDKDSLLNKTFGNHSEATGKVSNTEFIATLGTMLRCRVK